MTEELTRRQLQEQNDVLTKRLAELEAENVNKPKLEAALAELAALKKPQATGVAQGSQKLVPYRGKAQALEDCHIGGAYRNGPKEGKPGDVFDIDVPALWTDDPYVPVNVRYSEMNEPIVERIDFPRVDFRFRTQGAQSTQIEPLRASSY
jgi:hypothetical protein